MVFLGGGGLFLMSEVPLWSKCSRLLDALNAEPLVLADLLLDLGLDLRVVFQRVLDQHVLPGQGVGFRVQGSGFRVQGSGSQGSGFRVQGFRVQGFKVASTSTFSLVRVWG